MGVPKGAVLLAWAALAWTCTAAAGGKKYPVRPEDIVIAYPADDRHLVVARASRIWRKGVMRTYIANNSPPSHEVVEEGKLHNETWGHYPDDNPRRSLYPGDSRAALVPFLAHKHFGDTYKWLLYMDDDTIFFPDAVTRLLEDFDPDLPYFITDHLWWPDPRTPGMSSHPNKAAPRCLPCHFDDSAFNQSAMPFPAPKGCPCTPELICEATHKAHMGVFNRFCDMPRAPQTVYSMHGGAGGIMSVGLMRNVSFEFMERCTKSLYSTGGDAFISICLWQAGYAITDPGLGLFHADLQYFDPGPEDRVGAMLKLSQYIDSSPSRQCDEKCELQLEHMVSLHIRSRMFNTLDDAAAFIRGISIMYEVYGDIRRTKAAVAASAAASAAAADTAAAGGAADPARAAEQAAAVAAAAKEAAAALNAGGKVEKEEALKATAAAAAAAVAANAKAAAKKTGPDGRPLSQQEQKQKELAKALAEDAAQHQGDHRDAGAAVRERQKQREAEEVAAAKAQAVLRTAAADARSAAAGASRSGVAPGWQSRRGSDPSDSAGSSASAAAGGAAAGAGGAAAAAGGGGGVNVARRLAQL